MRSFLSLSVAVVAASAATLVMPTLASPQNAPAGVTGIVSALHPAAPLGGGSLSGAGGELRFGLSPRIALGLSSAWYLNAATEDETGGAGRPYDLMASALTVRASLVGDESDVALLLSPGLFRYSLGAAGGTGAETISVPTVGIGLGARIHLLGPVYLDFEGRDWVSFVREGEVGWNVGTERTIVHSPDIRIGLSVLFRKRDPVLASFEDLPLSYARDFRPVDATAVVRAPEALTHGRDHAHQQRGEIVPLRMTDSPKLGMQDMTVAVPAPVLVYDERQLGAIYFALGSHDVGTAYRSLLQDVARFMDENPDTRLAIRGFTDSSGSVQLNLSLAERRGTMVKELLVRMYGVDPGRIDVSSRGIDYRTAQAAQARRAELVGLLPQR